MAREWFCPACSSLNVAAATRCYHCGERPPSEDPAAPDRAQAGEARAGPGWGWAGLAAVVTGAVLVASVAFVGGGKPGTTPAPTAAPALVVHPPTPTGSPRPDASPSTIALPATFRLTGPWAVTFLVPGQSVVREVYVMTPRCRSGPCDVDAVIQDYSGTRLGKAVFTFADGAYTYEQTSKRKSACTTDSDATVAADEITRTRLTVAGYRPSGSAVVTPKIQGTRTVTMRSRETAGCPADAIELTALGEPTRWAREASTPPPSPRPTAAPKVKTVKAGYFGTRVSVSTYRVRGASPYDISRSISKEGPYSSWLGGSAAGLTKTRSSNRWHMESTAGGSCRIVVDAKPAITLRWTIVLPRWKPPASPPAATIRWWNEQLSGIAAHEKVHVDIYREAAKRLNSVLAKSTCANVEARLTRVWDGAQRDNCEFDMREYGVAAGLSLEACLRR